MQFGIQQHFARPTAESTALDTKHLGPDSCCHWCHAKWFFTRSSDFWAHL